MENLSSARTLRAGGYRIGSAEAGFVLWLAATAGVVYAINQGVYRLPVSPVPICSIVATPTTVDPGQEVNLRWTAQNGADFEIWPDLGRVTASGAKTVKPMSVLAEEPPREVCVQ